MSEDITERVKLGKGCCPDDISAKDTHQWRGGSEAAGEAARLMASPPSHTSFSFWSGERIMS